MAKRPADFTRSNRGGPQRPDIMPESVRIQEGRATSAEPPFDPWARAGQVALIGLFIIALLWCVYVARAVIVPVLLAWVIATIVLPVVRWLERYKVPRVLAVLLVTLMLLLLIVSLVALLSTPVAYWLGRATELTVLIKMKLQTISQPLALLEEARKALGAMSSEGGQPIVKVEQESATLIATVFSFITPAVSQSILFLGALLFYLIYQVKLRNTAVLLFTDRDTRLTTLHILSDVDESMSRYFGTFTLINLGLGTVTTVLTWLVGLPNPLLWGVLAAVLNYIPYIGPGMVILTLSIIGLLTFPTLSDAAIAPLAFLGIVTIEGQFMTPALMGRRLELNPFAVFLAVAICTWLMGALGAFLAVPLLIALAVTLTTSFAREKPDLPE